MTETSKPGFLLAEGNRSTHGKKQEKPKNKEPRPGLEADRGSIALVYDWRDIAFATRAEVSESAGRSPLALYDGYRFVPIWVTSHSGPPHRSKKTFRLTGGNFARPIAVVN